MDLTSLTDDYEVFNQSSPSLNVPEDMVFRGNPSAVFKSCWRANQGGEKLGSLLNPNFLLPHLNLLLVLLSHLHPPGLNKLTLKEEGNLRARRQWKLEDLVLPLKKRPTGQQSNREPVMSPAED